MSNFYERGGGGKEYESFERRMLRQPFRPTPSPERQFREWLGQQPFKPRDERPYRKSLLPVIPYKARKQVLEGMLPKLGRKLLRKLARGALGLRGGPLEWGMTLKDFIDDFKPAPVLQPGVPFEGYELDGWNNRCNLPGQRQKVQIGIDPGPLITCDPLALDVPDTDWGTTLNVSKFATYIGMGASQLGGLRMSRDEMWTRDPVDDDKQYPYIPPMTLLPLNPPPPRRTGPGGWLAPKPWRPVPFQPIPPFPPTPGDGPPYKPGRPKPGEKEKKGKLPNSLWLQFLLALRRIGEGLTEMVDLLEAIFGALPQDLINKLYAAAKRKDPKFKDWTPQQKLAILYKYANLIDMGKMAENVIMNDLQDRFFGSIGNYARELLQKNPYWRGLRGYQAGGRYRGDDGSLRRDAERGRVDQERLRLREEARRRNRELWPRGKRDPFDRYIEGMRRRF